MPPIERSKVRAMLEEAPEGQREPLLLRLKERGFTVVEDGAAQVAHEAESNNGVRQTISALARPILEVGGAVGGGVLGGGVGAPTIAGAIPGSIVGGGLGYAGGKSAADLLDRAMGLKPPIGSVTEAGGELTGNILAGAETEAGGAILGSAVQTGVKALGKLAPNATRAVKAALAANITPTIAQITQSKPWAMFEEATSRVPFFGKKIQAMRQAQESSYQALRTSAIEATGAKVTPGEIGEALTPVIKKEVEMLKAKREMSLAKLHRDLLKKGGDPATLESVARTFDDIRVENVEKSRITGGKHYDEVAELISPEADRVAHDASRAVTEKWSLRYENLPQAKKEAFSPLARGLLQDIKEGPGFNIIENAPNPMTKLDPLIFGGGDEASGAIQVLKTRKFYTFKEMQTLRSTVNGGLHQARLKGNDVEAAMLGDLKLGLDADIKSFGKTLQGDVSRKFEVATAYWRDTYKGIYRHDVVENLGEVARKNPQEVFDMLIGRGNVVDIKAVKAAVGEAGFAPMRRIAVERMVTSAEGRILSGPEITKNLASYTDDALSEILTPAQHGEIIKFRTTRELPKFVESELETRLRRVIFEPGFHGTAGLQRLPDDVTRRVISGDAMTFRAIKKITGEKGASQLRRLIIEDIMGEAYNPDILPNIDPAKTSFRMAKALKDYSDEFLKEAFPEKALAQIGQIDDIKALLESQSRLVAAPGTAPAFVAMMAPVAAGGLMFKHPVAGTTAVISAAVLSRLYVAETGRRILIEGLSPRNVKNLELYGRIIAAVANATRENAQEDRARKGTTK